MALTRNNILSGHGPQPPLIVSPQNGSPVREVRMFHPEKPDSPFDAIAALADQDQTSYYDWEDTGGKVIAGARDDWTEREVLFSVQAEPVDPETGLFRFQVPQKATSEAGLFLFSIGLYNHEDIPVVSNEGHLDVQPSAAFQQDLKLLRPAMVRRMLRDTHVRDNRILEEVEFSDGEIMGAIQDTVDEFNALPPTITNFRASNFRWPFPLSRGVIARLLEMAALWYERNDLKVQAAGLAADDMGKSRAYAQLAENYRRQWMEWTQITKRQININRGFGTLRSSINPFYYGVGLRGGRS